VKITSASGCIDSATYDIDVNRLDLTGFATPTSGCAPRNVLFTITASLPTNVTIADYTWMFGDLTAPQITPNNSNSHTYADSGSFQPKVVINTSNACADTFLFPLIRVGIPPINLVAFPKKLIYCGNEMANFYAYAPLANSYKWEYGDGNTETIPDTITSHKYGSLGVKTVKVTPLFNDCPGTPITFTITIIGVIANYKYANTCSNKKTFAFTNLSQGNISSSEWTFGDSSPTVNTLNAVHTFPPNGSFITQLIVADNITACKDTIQFSIYTATPTLINPDTFLCRNAPTSFTILNNYLNPFLSIN
jgi:hypothetical protein